MKRDQLDQAIDRVAARLTHVDDNEALASHIINALPDRITWFGWLFHSWAPRLAMIAIVVAAGIVWGNRRQEAGAPGASPIASFQPVTTPTALVAAVREAEPNRTMPLEPVEPVEPVEHLEPVEPLDRPDFERSLAPIEAMSALVMSGMEPDALPGSPALVLAPIAVTELPLTAESFSPR